MRRIGGAILLLAMSAGASLAQLPGGNIFWGYSYLSADTANTTGHTSLNGWEASLEGKVLPFIGLVADFCTGYGTYRRPFACPIFGCPATPTKEKINTYLFGPRVSVPILHVRPFAEALIGAAHT